MNPARDDRRTTVRSERSHRILGVFLGIEDNHAHTSAYAVVHPKSVLEPWQCACLRQDEIIENRVPVLSIRVGIDLHLDDDNVRHPDLLKLESFQHDGTPQIDLDGVDLRHTQPAVGITRQSH